MKENLVVITGGTSGLGLELVKLFKKTNKVLVITRKKKKELDGVMYAYGSVADEEFLKKIYLMLSRDYNISYLINNAGAGVFVSPEENDLEKINQVVSSNLVGLILNTTYALPLMKENGGKIVNVMSTAALKGNVNESLYCASKWGAKGYTESLKATFKGTNVKVVGVYPGGMNTAFWNANRSYVSEEKSAKWMNPVDVANVVFDSVTNDKVAVADVVIERI